MLFSKSHRLISICAIIFIIHGCDWSESEPEINRAVTPTVHKGWGVEQFERINKLVQQNQGEIDLLFIGDSITQRWAEAGKPVWDEYYGNRSALNIGVSGDRTEHVLWRLESGNIEGIFPKVTVILIGTNNVGVGRFTPTETLEGVKAVVQSVRDKRPDTKIILMGIFPRGRQFNEKRGQIAQINQALANLHDGKKVYFLDIGHKFVDVNGYISEDVMPSAIHPSEKGFLIWAKSLEPFIEDLLSN